jgi:hypothetical protein
MIWTLLDAHQRGLNLVVLAINEMVLVLAGVIRIEY